MRVARIIPETLAEGPGRRFSIWVQGCGHHCDGCFAVDLWDYGGGISVVADEITDRIRLIKERLDGVTFLGGEPFDQAAELAQIGAYAHVCGMNVITFTGYTYEELIRSDRADWKELLSATDLLIDGRYEKDNPERSRPLVGSANQRFLYLTGLISHETMETYKNRFEIRLDDNGMMRFNGMGNITRLLAVLDKM